MAALGKHNGLLLYQPGTVECHFKQNQDEKSRDMFLACPEAKPHSLFVNGKKACFHKAANLPLVVLIDASPVCQVTNLLLNKLMKKRKQFFGHDAVIINTGMAGAVPCLHWPKEENSNRFCRRVQDIHAAFYSGHIVLQQYPCLAIDHRAAQHLML
jgi:hypothetical protein